MIRQVNPFAKTRKPHDAYAVYRSDQAGFEWRVLKTYKLAKNEDQWSRWFVWAKSPFCPQGEMGDVYAADLRRIGAELVQGTSEWLAAYHSDEPWYETPEQIIDRVLDRNGDADA